MTVYEIIQQKEEQVERLTREISALRAAARMLEESRNMEFELVPAGCEVRVGETKKEQKTLRQFP
jgi:regulator of replication initiation timing